MHRAIAILSCCVLLTACEGEMSIAGAPDAGARDAASAPPRDAGVLLPGEDAGPPVPGEDAGGGPVPGVDAGPMRPDPVACSLPAPIDEGVTWERTLHVTASGADSGDGSAASPFRTINRALMAATPGTRIEVAAGTYSPIAVGGVAGAAGRPIAVVGVGAVVIDASSGVGIAGSDAAYLVLENLTIRGATIHGMNLDDGGSFDTPAHHLVLRAITIAGAGTGGNNDCIKLSGVDDFWVLASDVSGCNRGEIIDMVGCHRGVIRGNHFHDTVQSGVQTKGGSSDTVIQGNVFSDIPSRAINAGGSTGLAYIRPADATFEAARITIIGNVFVRNGADGGAAVAFVGSEDVVFAHNTIIEPRTWVARILQENTDARFVPSRRGLFVNNVIVLNAAEVRTYVNVGGGTAPDTFTFGSNLQFALDQGPGWPGLTPSGGVPAETGSLVQQDPRMVDRAGGDYGLMADSPARGAARALGAALPPDYDGHCYASPATLGAFEAP